VLGYCTVPLLIACIALRLLSVVISHISVRVIVVIAAYVWTMIASVKFLGNLEPSRRMLVLYPVGLFYLTLSWLIMNDV
jgi:hypothetical protein